MPPNISSPHLETSNERLAALILMKLPKTHKKRLLKEKKCDAIATDHRTRSKQRLVSKRTPSNRVAKVMETDGNGWWNSTKPVHGEPND